MIKNPPLVWMNDPPPPVVNEHNQYEYFHATCMKEIYTFSWYLYHELASGAHDNPHITQVCSRVSPDPVLERMRRDRGYGLLDPLNVFAAQKKDMFIHLDDYHSMLGMLYSVAHLLEWDANAPYSKLLSAQRGYSKDTLERISGKPVRPSVHKEKLLIDVYMQIAELLKELSVVLQKPQISDNYALGCFREARMVESYVFVQQRLGQIRCKSDIENMNLALNMFAGMSPIPSSSIAPNHRSRVFDPSNPNQNAGLFENENPLFAYNNDPYVYQAFTGFLVAKSLEFKAFETAYKILGELVMCAVMCAG